MRDLDKLLRKIVDLSKKYNVHFSTIGYDTYFNENFLIKCATQTGENAYFIEPEHVDSFPSVVDHEISLIKSIAYRNISLHFNLLSELKIVEVFGGNWEDNKIFVQDLQQNYVKPLIIKLQGRPIGSADIIVEVHYANMSNINEHPEREYIDLQVYSDDFGYNKKTAPYIMVYKTLWELAESLNNFQMGRSRRADCAFEFRRKLGVLQPIRLQLHSSYFDRWLNRLQRILFVVKNEAIDDQDVVKSINYLLYQYLTAFRDYQNIAYPKKALAYLSFPFSISNPGSSQN